MQASPARPAWPGPGRRQAAPAVDFRHFDITRDKLWAADLVVVRDLLFHFEARLVWQVLSRLDASGSTYLLTTSYDAARFRNNVSAAAYRAGRGFSSFWKINLQDEPFSLPPPLLAIGRDGNPPTAARPTGDRYVGLWKLPLWAGRERPPEPPCDYHAQSAGQDSSFAVRSSSFAGRGASPPRRTHIRPKTAETGTRERRQIRKTNPDL